MRIDNLDRTRVAPGAEKLGQTAPELPTDKDTVAVSNQSDQAQVSQLAHSLAAAHQERLDQLRLQVQAGSYDVSAPTLANSLIDAHLKE